MLPERRPEIAPARELRIGPFFQRLERRPRCGELFAFSGHNSS
jgi:hypothetical protein